MNQEELLAMLHQHFSLTAPNRGTLLPEEPLEGDVSLMHYYIEFSRHCEDHGIPLDNNLFSLWYEVNRERLHERDNVKHSLPSYAN